MTRNQELSHFDQIILPEPGPTPSHTWLLLGQSTPCTTSNVNKAAAAPGQFRLAFTLAPRQVDWTPPPAFSHTCMAIDLVLISKLNQQPYPAGLSAVNVQGDADFCRDVLGSFMGLHRCAHQVVQSQVIDWPILIDHCQCSQPSGLFEEGSCRRVPQIRQQVLTSRDLSRIFLPGPVHTRIC